MNKKTKLISLSLAFCLMISFVVIGVLALRNATMTMGGNVGFIANGINATVTNATLDNCTILLDGDSEAITANEFNEKSQQERGKLVDLVFTTKDKNQASSTSDKESWNNLNLFFVGDGDPFSINFTVTNLGDENICVVAKQNPDEMTDSKLDLSYSESFGEEIEKNASLDFSVFVSIATEEDKNYDFDNAHFSVLIELKKTEEIPYYVESYLSYPTLDFYTNEFGRTEVRAKSKDITSEFCPSGDLEIPAAVVLKGGDKVIVREIAYGAFSGCTGLTSVVIPETIDTVGVYAFENCENITSIVIPTTNVHFQTNRIGETSFSGCEGLYNDDNLSNNGYYLKDRNGNNILLLGMKENSDTFEIDENCTTLYVESLSKLTGSSIFIPINVKNIPTQYMYGYATGPFQGCSCTIYCEAPYAPEGYEYGWNWYDFQYSGSSLVTYFGYTRADYELAIAG